MRIEFNSELERITGLITIIFAIFGVIGWISLSVKAILWFLP